MYHQILNGNTPDQNLLYGHPQAIRSDEWLVQTPFTAAQSKVDYPLVNPNIGAGFDTSIILDLPHREWTALFRPENFAFFVLPLENAFAFKWWFVSYLLVMAVYALTLVVVP